MKFFKAQTLITGQFRKILTYRCPENHRSFGIKKNVTLGHNTSKAYIYPIKGWALLGDKGQ